jgi:predicted RNA-binding Zn ribbon-like protein
MTPSEQQLLCGFLQTSHEANHLENVGSLRRWLLERRLIGEDDVVSEDDVRRARRLRAALISMFAANNGAEADERARPVIEELTANTPMTFTLGGDGRLVLRANGDGVAAVLVEIAAIVYRAGVAGDFTRLKACRKCRWPFYDSSKNRSRTWCDMGLCGSQEKSREYRKRKSAAAN